MECVSSKVIKIMHNNSFRTKYGNSGLLIRNRLDCIWPKVKLESSKNKSNITLFKGAINSLHETWV